MNGAANAADSEAEAVATVRHHGGRPLEPERYRRRRRLVRGRLRQRPGTATRPRVHQAVAPLDRGELPGLAFHWTATGTQDGAFGPIPATGRAVTYAGA